MTKRGLLLTLTEPPAGKGKYLATYELDSVDVLASPAYLARFQNPTPWSRRCLGKAVVFKRWACEQVDPGAAEPHPAARALLLDAEAPGALQVRRFAAQGGERLVLCELGDMALGGTAGIVYRLYRPAA